MAKQLILETISQQGIGTVLETLRSTTIKAPVGAIVGCGAIILVEDVDVERALNVLARAGIGVRIG